MPYTVDSPNLPADVKKLPPKKKRMWVHVWTSMNSNTKIPEKERESRAFAAAYSAVKNMPLERLRTMEP